MIFHVEINRGQTQVLEAKTSLYDLAAAAALAMLDYEPTNDIEVVKIWVPHLLPDYGPYFYYWKASQGFCFVIDKVAQDALNW